MKFIGFIANFISFQNIYIYCYILFKSKLASHSRVETLPRWFCPFKKNRKFFIFFFARLQSYNFYLISSFCLRKIPFLSKDMNIFLKKSMIFFYRVLIGLVTKKNSIFNQGRHLFPIFYPYMQNFKRNPNLLSKISLLDVLTLNFLLLRKFLFFGPTLTLKALG